MESNRNHFEWFKDCLGAVFVGLIKGLYFLIDQAWVIFFVALLLFMFNPPLKAFPFDRIAFLLLIVVVAIASLTRQKLLFLKSPLLLPMIGLIILVTVSAIQAPYKIQTWSTLANTFIVPYAMFFLAKAVFSDDKLIQYFFFFCALIAAYLTFTAIFFLLDAKFLIFPRYILNPSTAVGSEEFLDRACGPFLNPVANGTAIIILGLVTLSWFLKIKSAFSRILLFPILISLPFGIIATMTRGVWLSCLFAIAYFIISTKYSNIRRSTGIIWLMFLFLGIWLVTDSTSIMGLVFERLHDEHNINFRLDLYTAAFDMFKEKPILGWGTNVAPSVVDRYSEAYTSIDVSLHNTYLDVLVGQGIVGFLLYASIIVYLFNIGKHIPHISGEKDANMIDREFVLVFRNILCVYLINGFFVVMLYQFTNALVFTIAGIISAREAQVQQANS